MGFRVRLADLDGTRDAEWLGVDAGLRVPVRVRLRVGVSERLCVLDLVGVSAELGVRVGVGATDAVAVGVREAGRSAAGTPVRSAGRPEIAW